MIKVEGRKILFINQNNVKKYSLTAENDNLFEKSW